LTGPWSNLHIDRRQYFRDVAAVVNASGPPNKAALVAVMGRYGLVPAAPK
jgi:hypothetical protein